VIYVVATLTIKPGNAPRGADCRGQDLPSELPARRRDASCTTCTKSMTDPARFVFVEQWGDDGKNLMGARRQTST